MLLRSLSAASQSLASKPMLAELLFDDLVDLARGISSGAMVAQTATNEKGKIESRDPNSDTAIRLHLQRAACA